MTGLVKTTADADMCQDFFERAFLRIQLAVVPFGENVIADEPAHCRGREDVAWEMPAGRQSGAYYRRAKSVSNDRHDDRVFVLVGPKGRQRPGINDVP